MFISVYILCLRKRNMCVETTNVRWFKDMKNVQIEHKKIVFFFYDSVFSIFSFFPDLLVSQLFGMELKIMSLSIRQNKKY